MNQVFNERKKKLLFHDVKKPARAIKFAYILAFTIIALLSVSVHIITAYIIDKQSKGIEITKRLESLSYYINESGGVVDDLLFSLRAGYYNRDELNHYLNNAKEILPQTSERFSDLSYIHNNLFPDKSLENAESNILYYIFFSKELDLDKRTKDYLENLDYIYDCIKLISTKHALNSDNFSSQLQLSSAEELFSLFIHEMNDEYADLPKLYNLATLDFVKELHAQLALLKKAQQYLIFMILIVIVLEAFFIFQPLIKKVESYHQKLLKQALEDPLTGLSNRRAFMKTASAELSYTRRNQEPYIIALTDLDHFKSVNDTYGHDIGDEVLKHFSNILKESIREEDSVGRIGGEEFAIVLAAGTKEKEGIRTLERLCKKVSSTPCIYKTDKGEKGELSYTVSIGYVAVPPGQQQQEVQAFLKAADLGLYTAKEKGRNCVVEGNLETLH
jgi:diguanylate cyclase (GGDEF)-like protein